MAMLAVLAVASLLGWTIWRDRDQGRRRRNLALLLMAGAALLLVKGQWLLALLLGATALWARTQGSLPRSAALPPALPADDLAARLAEARALLGVDADAGSDAIAAAHRRLIARNHPDAGGTAALASRINAARDLLLAHRQDG